MRPLLHENRDLVVILKKDGRLRRYDVALYRRGTTYVLHRVVGVRDEGYLIRGDNTYALERVPEDAVLGVLVSPETVKLLEDGTYLAARVRSACDFIALDLRALSPDADKTAAGLEENEKSELEVLLDEMEYYVSSYKMRIVLSKNNSELYDALVSLGVNNIQIIEE
jgi:hypothetical protein